MSSTVRRGAALALVGTLSLVVPLANRVEEPALATFVAIGPFLFVAVVALVVGPKNLIFELFARPADRRDGKLYSLAGFSLTAAALAILTIEFGMPNPVYVTTVLLLSFGTFGGHLVRLRTHEPVVATAGFVTVGFLAGAGGQLVAGELTGMQSTLSLVAFLAATGSLLAALLRTTVFKRDDPLVLGSVALSLWLLAALPIELATTRVSIALVVTVLLGYISFALDTASLPGMLTGVLLGFLTIVLGDYGWFGMLIAFFAIGGLSSKFRYEDKKCRGIAEEDEGARGTGNVLANSLVALVAVVGAAASSQIALPPEGFLFVFAGAVGAALADTLSSEIGGLFDNPRLITTLRVVEPGTDGAITWQGELVGFVGAGIIAAIGFVAFEAVTPLGAAVILAAGVIGMTVDSLLGATIEGWLCGNQGVNFLATLSAAIAGGALAVAIGIVSLP